MAVTSVGTLAWGRNMQKVVALAVATAALVGCTQVPLDNVPTRSVKIETHPPVCDTCPPTIKSAEWVSGSTIQDFSLNRQADGSFNLNIGETQLIDAQEAAARVAAFQIQTTGQLVGDVLDPETLAAIIGIAQGRP